MEEKHLQEVLGPPQIAKLKALGKGILIGKVLGMRVLVKTISPFTKMDEVEKQGLLYIPESVKQQNEPLPSTGIVLQVGEEVKQSPAYSAVLTEGTAVMFSKFAGTSFVVEEETGFRVLDVSEIMCTLEIDEGVLAPVAG